MELQDPSEEPAAQATTLADLGWSERFRKSIDDDTLAATPPARICDVHRDRVIVSSATGEHSLALPTGHDIGDVTVGDWVLFDPASATLTAVLERANRIHRAVGAGYGRQLIAANVDTLMIVTSCDDDFNPARLERYLALAHASDTLPLIVLTKTDLVDDVSDYRTRAARLSPLISVVDVDARSADDLERLLPWVRAGQTAALVGSSGVGKSTLLNGLTGSAAATRPVRADDSKGRHTTTARSLRRAIAGGSLIDTPGMRELGLGESADGIDAVFDDLATLCSQCRFTNCTHESEPGCAIREAIERGELDAERLARWRKLRREDLRHTASVAETRERDRDLGRRIRATTDAKRARRSSH